MPTTRRWASVTSAPCGGGSTTCWSDIPPRRRRTSTWLAARGWPRLPGGQRVEIRERHEQRSYSEAEITAALSSASLKALETYTFDPYGEGRPVKLFCVVRHS